MTDWQVNPDASDDEAGAALSADRVWNCFAIADLDQSFRSHTTVRVASKGGQTATLLLLNAPGLTVISPSGPADGVAALLAGCSLPERTFIQAQRNHIPTIETVFSPSEPWQELYRMWAEPDSFLPAPPSRYPVLELGPEDTTETRSFYGPMARGPFPDEQLREGMFRAIRIDGHLAAVAGTHVFSPTYGIAVVGGVLTAETYRRRGLARTVTARLTADLFAAGCSLVALNVVTSNRSAVNVYESLGYRIHSTFLSTIAGRIASDRHTA